MSATFFGEINELNSRAVWYSDEESSSDEESIDQVTEKNSHQLIAKDHDKVTKEIQFDYLSLDSNKQYEFTNCLISLSTPAKFKNFRLGNTNLVAIGQFGSVAKAFAWDSGDQRPSLWIMIDASHRYVNGYMVSYFVEKLIKKINTSFKFSKEKVMIILSQQYSSGDSLEYLTNSPLRKNPFIGRHMVPPNLISNHFESALFEHSTVSFQPTSLVCLPDPKNCWFDNVTGWPTLPDTIIKHRLQDDFLDHTLIFV